MVGMHEEASRLPRPRGEEEGVGPCKTIGAALCWGLTGCIYEYAERSICKPITYDYRQRMLACLGAQQVCVCVFLVLGMTNQSFLRTTEDKKPREVVM